MASKLELSDLGLDSAAAAPSVPSAPGKMSATSRLAPRAQVVFRVESAAAAAVFAERFGPRDPNGVSAGADTAIDRASGSSGAALPEPTRARFERSLGADLSAVRVHTGEASAEAAGAVGARAYTTGNDIHFGAGQYAPDDPFGMHLLAHEVAHTQQQAGGAATTQYKLEVSSPGDAAESEADRAADAMVTGAPAPGPLVDHLAPDQLVSKPVKVDDPYERSPADWTGFPPATAAAFSPVFEGEGISIDPAFVPTFEFSEPIGPTGDDGNSAPPTEKQVLAAETAKAAFATALRTVAGSTSAVYPLIPAFRSAHADLDALGSFGFEDIGGKPDLAQLTLGQSANGVSMAQVFESGSSSGVNTSAQVDLSASKVSQDAKDKAAALKTVLGRAKVEKKLYEAEILTNKGLSEAFANELFAAEIMKEEATVDGMKADLAGAEAEKARITSDIEARCKSLEMVLGFASFASDPMGNWDALAGVWLTIGETIATDTMTTEINQKISGLSAAIAGATGRLAGYKVKLQLDKVEAARKLQAASAEKVSALTAKIAVTRGEVRDAYVAFSKAAGAAAGGSEANQKKVEMAIRGIPAAEHLVATLARITLATDLPPWTEAGGRGYNASGDAAGFRLHYGNLRAVREQFGGQTALWGKRLASMKAVAGALGMDLGGAAGGQSMKP